MKSDLELYSSRFVFVIKYFLEKSEKVDAFVDIFDEVLYNQFRYRM